MAAEGCGSEGYKISGGAYGAAEALGLPKAASMDPQFSQEVEVAHTRNSYQLKEEHPGNV